MNGVYQRGKHLDQIHVLKGISASNSQDRLREKKIRERSERDNISLNEERGRGSEKWEKRNILQNHQDMVFH